MSRKKKKPYRVIICPSSEEESDERLEAADTYRKVLNLMAKGDLNSMCEHEFNTEEELDAFIEGYEAAAGWLGEGWYFTDVPKPRVEWEAAT